MTARRIIKRPQIHDLGQLCEAVGVDNFRELEQAVFRGSECGAWIRSEAGQIVVGADVAIWSTTHYPIAYPFALGEFWQALENVELDGELLEDAAIHI